MQVPFFDKIVKKRGKKFFNRLYKPKRSITFDYAPLIALFYFHINKVCAFLLPVLRAAAAALRKIGLAAAAPVKNFVCFFAVFAAVGINAVRVAEHVVYPAACFVNYAYQQVFHGSYLLQQQFSFRRAVSSGVTTTKRLPSGNTRAVLKNCGSCAS